MVKLIPLGCLLLLSGVLMYSQSEFKVVFERMEIIRFNRDYVGLCRTHNFKYNRTQAVCNLTVQYKRDFGNELQLEVQAYKMASNEYRQFPIRFMFNFCDYARKNEFGLGMIFHCGNFSCPLKKGYYRACHWMFNSTNFPPNIPGGSYMLDNKLFFRDVEVYFLQVYGTVKYPEIKGWSFF